MRPLAAFDFLVMVGSFYRWRRHSIRAFGWDKKGRVGRRGAFWAFSFWFFCCVSLGRNVALDHCPVLWLKGGVFSRLRDGSGNAGKVTSLEVGKRASASVLRMESTARDVCVWRWAATILRGRKLSARRQHVIRFFIFFEPPSPWASIWSSSTVWYVKLLLVCIRAAVAGGLRVGDAFRVRIPLPGVYIAGSGQRAREFGECGRRAAHTSIIRTDGWKWATR